MALRLFGITVMDGHHGEPPEGLQLLAFRDLAAVVDERAEYEIAQPTPADVEHYQEVVESVFNHRPVIPAPIGTLFRSPDTLVRWMELHYVALSDALAFVEDRLVARVHIRRAGGETGEPEGSGGMDAAASAAEAFRALRRRAVVAIPLRRDHTPGVVLSSAFLVERELWKEFASTVQEQQENDPTLDLEMTGPWPPYDFVRMQFGG